MKIKVALIGSSGYIGEAIKKRLISDERFEVITTTRDLQNQKLQYFDLQKYHEMNYSFLDKCEYVIIAAAISSLEFCEKEEELTYKVNVLGTKNLIEKAIERKCKVVFLSSDAVYGPDSSVFDEESLTNPISKYGKMKKEIEESFKNNKHFKVIRLSYVFSANDKFTKYYLSCLKNGNTAEIFHPFYRNVICITSVINLIMNILENWADSPKIVNACGRELISRIEIADTINRILRRDYEYSIISMDAGFVKVRPKFTQIRSLYLEKLITDSERSFYEKAYQEIINEESESV